MGALSAKQQEQQQRDIDEFVAAAGRGDVEAVRRRLDLVNGKASSGETALIAAASAVPPRLPVIELLLGSSGVHANAKDTTGETALMRACCCTADAVVGADGRAVRGRATSIYNNESVYCDN